MVENKQNVVSKEINLLVYHSHKNVKIMEEVYSRVRHVYRNIDKD